jgi:glycosyltransferase involved in cell wall biosynthesis
VPSEVRPGLYAHADVYACPTTGGASFGITLLEAMACRTPIVCSDLAGFRSVVTHDREAVLVPRGQPAALADALARVLGDAALRVRLGAAGRAHVVTHFSWSRVAEAVLGLYEGILARARAA